MNMWPTAIISLGGMVDAKHRVSVCESNPASIRDLPMESMIVKVVSLIVLPSVLSA